MTTIKLGGKRRYIVGAAHQPHEYLHILYWGRLLGSYPDYIKGEQIAAAKAGAPLNAVYRQGERWLTADDCHANKRDQLNALVANHKKDYARD